MKENNTVAVNQVRPASKALLTCSHLMQVTKPVDRNKEELQRQFGPLTTGGVHVTFFGDNGSVAYVEPCAIKSFQQMDEPKSGKLRCAVREANLGAAARIAELSSPQNRKRQRQQ